MASINSGNKSVNEVCQFINKIADKGERILNGVNSTPLAVLGGSAVRGFLGSKQFSIGTVVCIVSLVCWGTTTVFGASKETRATMKNLTKFGAEHTIHGALNVIRAVGESTLQVCTLGLATFIIFPINASHGFKSVFEYGDFFYSESKRF